MPRFQRKLSDLGHGKGNKKKKKKKGSFARHAISLVIVMLMLLLLASTSDDLFNNSNSNSSINGDAMLLLASSSSSSKTANGNNNNNNPSSGPFNVSVVVMNHGRPKTLQGSNLLPTLLAHPRVTEILLCHSNPQTKFIYNQSKKVRNVDAIETNTKMGLALRFHHCIEAQNPWVMHVDDDQEFNAAAVTDLLQEFARNPRRIVGNYGRNWGSDNAYNWSQAEGNVEVVLTKFMIAERRICQAFFKYQHVVWKDVVQPLSKPLWNGEDIFFSLTANHVYGHDRNNNGTTNDDVRPNFAMNLGVVEAKLLDEQKNVGIAGNSIKPGASREVRRAARKQLKEHLKYRSTIWTKAKTALASLKERR